MSYHDAPRSIQAFLLSHAALLLCCCAAGCWIQQPTAVDFHFIFFVITGLQPRFPLQASYRITVKTQ